VGFGPIVFLAEDFGIIKALALGSLLGTRTAFSTEPGDLTSTLSTNLPSHNAGSHAASFCAVVEGAWSRLIRSQGWTSMAGCAGQHHVGLKGT
jgi:hypothetical protein